MEVIVEKQGVRSHRLTLKPSGLFDNGIVNIFGDEAGITMNVPDHSGVNGNSDKINKQNKSLKDSVVSIHIDGIYTNSGFFISRDGYILTCFHTGEEELYLHNPTIEVEIFNRDGAFEYSNAILKEYNRSLDYAILKIDKKDCIPVEFDTGWKVGGEFASFGYMNAESGFVGGSICGTISGITRIEKPDGVFEFITLRGDAFQKGLSGSPLLFLETGKVVGIIVSGYSKVEFNGKRDIFMNGLAIRYRDIARVSEILCFLSAEIVQYDDKSPGNLTNCNNTNLKRRGFTHIILILLILLGIIAATLGIISYFRNLRCVKILEPRDKSFLNEVRLRFNVRGLDDDDAVVLLYKFVGDTGWNYRSYAHHDGIFGPVDILFSKDVQTGDRMDILAIIISKDELRNFVYCENKQFTILRKNHIISVYKK